MRNVDEIELEPLLNEEPSQIERRQRNTGINKLLTILCSLNITISLCLTFVIVCVLILPFIDFSRNSRQINEFLGLVCVFASVPLFGFFLNLTFLKGVIVDKFAINFIRYFWLFGSFTVGIMSESILLSFLNPALGKNDLEELIEKYEKKHLILSSFTLVLLVTSHIHLVLLILKYKDQSERENLQHTRFIRDI